ncbi:hypothetical protein BaRGS_00010431 [Batillaria attramentaria]|uniref:Uncharacterized protein n=1 Tax=Batillaria attramentaria TaxID=370345 RepID=A0ABD0LFN5_9CAEN
MQTTEDVSVRIQTASRNVRWHQTVSPSGRKPVSRPIVSGRCDIYRHCRAGQRRRLAVPGNAGNFNLFREPAASPRTFSCLCYRPLVSVDHGPREISLYIWAPIDIKISRYHRPLWNLPAASVKIAGAFRGAAVTHDPYISSSR